MSPKASAKKVDKKGRVLIPELADSMVLVEKIGEGEFLVKAAELVPTREAWLYKNQIAKKPLEQGLADARSGKLVQAVIDNSEWTWMSKLEK